MSERILVVEDDLALRTGLGDTFADEGFDVTTASDGLQADELVFGRHFDVIVLDLMLPGRSGLEILRRLRTARIETPVLILTAKGDEDDRVLGLELGADDYLAKPFSVRELVARVRALVRRERRALAGTSGRNARFAVGTSVRVDLGAYELTRDGVTTRLSPKEAGMLALLYAAAGQAVRRERFLDEVWGSDDFVGPRTVDTHVLNLRQKIEADPKRPRHLRTVHGVGYRLVL